MFALFALGIEKFYPVLFLLFNLKMKWYGKNEITLFALKKILTDLQNSYLYKNLSLTDTLLSVKFYSPNTMVISGEKNYQDFKDDFYVKVNFTPTDYKTLVTSYNYKRI